PVRGLVACAFFRAASTRAAHTFRVAATSGKTRSRGSSALAATISTPPTTADNVDLHRIMRLSRNATTSRKKGGDVSIETRASAVSRPSERGSSSSGAGGMVSGADRVPEQCRAGGGLLGGKVPAGRLRRGSKVPECVVRDVRQSGEDTVNGMRK